MAAIKILITGGTFDKEYNEITGQLYFNGTHMPEILKKARCDLDVEIKTLIIMHGTDTMVETAKILANSVINKTIVLTGSMIPFKYGNSDVLFNFGNAIAFLQILQPGIYIAMNGKCFSWNNVRKNKEAGKFEKVRDTGY